jgi:hypothetical protein
MASDDSGHSQQCETRGGVGRGGGGVVFALHLKERVYRNRRSGSLGTGSALEEARKGYHMM